MSLRLQTASECFRQLWTVHALQLILAMHMGTLCSACPNEAVLGWKILVNITISSFHINTT